MVSCSFQRARLQTVRLIFHNWRQWSGYSAKMAISAGIVNHNSPFKRKNKNPQKPSFLSRSLSSLIQQEQLRLVSTAGGTDKSVALFHRSSFRLYPYWILPQALVFQLSMASSPRIHGGNGINSNSESALT